MSEKTRLAEQENATGTSEELVELLSGFRTAILVTHRDGLPRARPLAIVRVEPNGVVWFATADHSPKVSELAIDPSVAVICHRGRDEAWISMSGRAELVRDRALARDMWDAGMKAWFSGPDDPALLLIRVDPVHAEYYAAEKPFVTRAFELVKGMASTSQPPHTGVTKHVDLDRLSEPGRLSH